LGFVGKRKDWIGADHLVVMCDGCARHFPELQESENGRAMEEWFIVSAKEYREFADECMGWAKTARSDQERQIFVQMAQTWLWAAARLDGDASFPFPEYVKPEQSASQNSSP
jgi:hypothetical protein